LDWSSSLSSSDDVELWSVGLGGGRMPFVLGFVDLERVDSVFVEFVSVLGP